MWQACNRLGQSTKSNTFEKPYFKRLSTSSTLMRHTANSDTVWRFLSGNHYPNCATELGEHPYRLIDRPARKMRTPIASHCCAFTWHGNRLHSFLYSSANLELIDPWRPRRCLREGSPAITHVLKPVTKQSRRSFRAVSALREQPSKTWQQKAPAFLGSLYALGACMGPLIDGIHGQVHLVPIPPRPCVSSCPRLHHSSAAVLL